MFLDYKCMFLNFCLRDICQFLIVKASRIISLVLLFRNESQGMTEAFHTLPDESHY
jgi:hypothetical protein